MDATATAGPPGIGAHEADPQPPPADEAGGDSWRARLEHVGAQMRACIETRVHLAGLETRRAAHLSLYAIALSVLGALLAVTAWLALIAGAVVWAVQSGLALHWVLIGVAAGSVLLAWLSMRAGREAVSRISFDATWRTLARRPEDGPNDASAGGSR